MKILSGQFKLDSGWSWSSNQTTPHDCQPNSSLASSATQLALVFGPEHLLGGNPALVELKKKFPDAIIAGASTYGVIDNEFMLDELVQATVVEFSKVQLKQVDFEVTSIEGSADAGFKLGEALREGQAAGMGKLAGIFLLADGLNINGTELLSGLNRSCADVPIAGGMAGDGTRFKQTKVVCGERASAKVVTAIGFYGDSVIFQRGCQSGPVGFGPMRRVTKSEGNIVYEIDGQPALDLYRTYLGELADQLPASATYFPLSMRRNSADETPLLRSVLGIDENYKSITVAGDMPRGSWTQLMRASHAQLLNGAQAAIDEALEGLSPTQPVLNLTVSCFGRRVLLGERTDDELEIIQDALPSQSRQIGFFSYGEISSNQGNTCDFHNMTLAITAIAETEV
jgi:hypothetical protein